MKFIYPDYSNSNIGIPNSFLNYFCGKKFYNTNKLLDDKLKKNYKNIVYIILDGMGKNVLEKHFEEDSFFRTNLSSYITTVYPSSTVPATTALHSGLAPYNTSWIGWHQYFKDINQSVEMFLNNTYLTNEKHNVLDYVSYEDIYSQMVSSNNKINFFRMYPKCAGGEYENLSDMFSFIENNQSSAEEINFFSVYSNEPDGLLHNYGINSSEVNLILEDISIKISKLSKKLNDTLIVITADHGLIDTNICDISGDKELTDCFSYIPTGEFRCPIFHIKRGMEKTFENIFNDRFHNSYVLYTKEKFITSGLLGNGNKHILLDDFLGDYVATAISDVSITYNVDNKVFDSLKADHGGLTEEEMIVPMILIDCNEKTNF
ncbi:MAG: alkaline phosphatase family protein [bacterium]